MSVLGATSPRLEELLSGALSQSHLHLIHPHLTLDAGEAYVGQLDRARQRELGRVVLVVEGSMFDQSRAGTGFFSQLGQRGGEPVTVEAWISQLAPMAEAVVAIGTCAVSGGIPAAAGNVTGATGLGALLGADFRSRAGLPLITVPGCAPSGDAFLEALQYLVLHLEGVVPIDLDELGRPGWLYAEETPLQPVGDAPRGAEPLMAACPVPQRGWINRLGGCARVGGGCNGCTRPDFPDGTLPAVATLPLMAS